MKLQKFFAVICTILLLGIVSATPCDARKKDDKAKYIFLFIGDGMGMSHIAVTESYLSYKAGKLGGEMLAMSTFPYFGTSTSYSANNNVTDSSAAGTAIATGEKTNNYTLSVDTEGNPLKSMAYDLKEDGYQIGLMSTGPINHATPAAFFASSRDRGDYYNISKQIIGSGFDYFAGSGFLEFRGREDKEEPIDIYLEANGYEVCYGVDEYRKENEGKKDKLIYCQASNRNESAKDYVTSGKPADDATLGEMLELGLEYFNENSPFFFMCEGGDIDWAGHANKTMPLVSYVLELDDAVKVALEFYRKYPKETLIVVTADHETGGVSLGSGHHVDWAVLEEQWEKDGHLNNLSNEENRKLNRKASIGWTTGGHTGGHVPVFAIGKGAEKFGGRMDNTDIKGKILCE